MSTAAYRRLMQSNPYRILREAAGMTQSKVADKIDVTPQYIYRHEAGLINTPSASLAELYCAELDEDDVRELSIEPQFLTPQNIELMYYKWVSNVRDYIHAIVDEELKHINPIQGPYKVVSSLRDEHPFYNFMFNFNYMVGAKLLIQGDLRSQQLFNRLILIHPRATQLYLAGTDHVMPKSLDIALATSGVVPVIRATLEDIVKVWLSRRKT